LPAGSLQSTVRAHNDAAANAEDPLLHKKPEWCRPITGLFAAGRTTSGLAAWGYASGNSLGGGSFYGHRAGRSAARA
jgi:3-oxo-5alpha-steroid 4-dehydrogenase